MMYKKQMHLFISYSSKTTQSRQSWALEAVVGYLFHPCGLIKQLISLWKQLLHS